MAVLGTGRDEERLADLAARRSATPTGSRRWPSTSPPTTRPRASSTPPSQRWGRIDFLVNNAGVGSPKPLHETDDESLDYFLGLMLRAPFRLARDVIPHMQPGFGDHQRHVDVRGRRRPARRRVLGGQGRADRADHAHRLPVRPAGNPLQRRGARRDADADGRPATRRRAVPQDQHRDDAAPAARRRRATSPARSRSCAPTAAASSTARRSSSTAAGARRSICPTSR